MKLPLEGGCRCDAVRIRLKTAPVMTMACHCTGCQRMSSSAFSLTAMADSASFEVLKGAPVVGGLHRPEAQHFFCPECMTWMFTRPAAIPQLVNIRPTMFDDHAWFVPFVETWTSEKLSWPTTPAVHSYPGFPPPEDFERLGREFAEWAKQKSGP